VTAADLQRLLHAAWEGSDPAAFPNDEEGK